MALVLIAAVIIYLGAVYLFISKRYLRTWVRVKADETARETATKTVSGEQGENAVNDRYKLARAVRIILSVLHGIVFFLLILWFPVTLFALLFPEFMPDIEFFVWYAVDIARMPEVDSNSLFNQLAGTTQLSIPAPNRFSYMMFQVTNLVAGVLTVTVLKLLRNIFASYTNGEPFTSGNSHRLETIGRILIFAYVAAPFWHYFLSLSVINLVRLDTPDVRIISGTEANITGILIGIALLVLSGVIRQAETANAEQRLTV